MYFTVDLKVSIEAHKAVAEVIHTTEPSESQHEREHAKESGNHNNRNSGNCRLRMPEKYSKVLSLSLFVSPGRLW